MEAYVYRWVNTLNGMWYIGSHNGSKENYIGSGTYFRRAYNKDKSYFKREIILRGDYKSVLDMEDSILKYLNASKDPESYNLKDSAIGGVTRTGEDHPFHSSKGNTNPFQGKTHSLKSRQKMKESWKARKKFGRVNSGKKKAVYSEVLDKRWESLTSCRNELGFGKSKLEKILYGKTKTNELKLRYAD